MYTTCLVVLIQGTWLAWVGNDRNCGLCFNSSMFVFVFSFNIFFLSYQILFLKKMAKFVLIICCTLLPVCDLCSLIYFSSWTGTLFILFFIFMYKSVFDTFLLFLWRLNCGTLHKGPLHFLLDVGHLPLQPYIHS